MPDTALYLSADEAAAELGVSRATLYAYVSRGKIRSVARSGTRSRLYVAEDVRRLLARGAAETAARGAAVLDWGGPVLDSAITLIADHALYYRGRDAVRLAGAQSLEAVATLLWNCERDPFLTSKPDIAGEGGHRAGRAKAPGMAREGGRSVAREGARGVAREGPHGAGRERAREADRPVDRAAVALCVLAPRDPYAHNFTPRGLRETGARVLRHVTAAVLDTRPSAAPIHEQCAGAFQQAADGADALRRALVLCADHELNASTFAVRVVASTGASIHRAVTAGLAALVGPEHGGMTERTDALLAALLTAPEPSEALTARLRRGDSLPGFGHPLYPKGDPRARALIRHLTARAPADPAVVAFRAIELAARRYAGLHPTLDLALSFLAQRLGLPPGSALGLFAIGRTAGWIAHALEQYSSGQRIRPRARYVGEHPA